MRLKPRVCAETVAGCRRDRWSPGGGDMPSTSSYAEMTIFRGRSAGWTTRPMRRWKPSMIRPSVDGKMADATIDQEYPMQVMRRVPQRILALAFLMILAPSHAASKVELDARIRATINELNDIQAGRELVAKSVAMLVFPKTLKGGIGLGAEYGEGALLVNGKTEQYYKLTSVSFGLQLGGQSRSQVVLFMTQDALATFRASNGWEAGVDGSIAVVEFGVGKQVDTNTIRDPIIGFMFDNKGLMYDLSFVGTKFWQQNKT